MQADGRIKFNTVDIATQTVFDSILLCVFFVNYFHDSILPALLISEENVAVVSDESVLMQCWSPFALAGNLNSPLCRKAHM